MARIYLDDAKYEGDDLILACYLETSQRPDEMANQRFQQLRCTFLGRDDYMFKRSWKRRSPPRRIIGKPEQWEEILWEIHNEIGHHE